MDHRNDSIPPGNLDFRQRYCMINVFGHGRGDCLSRAAYQVMSERIFP